MDFWMMFTWWPSLVMGWPAVGASLIAFAAGIGSQRAKLVFAGSIISTPFCLYVSAFPRIGLFGLTVLILNFVSAWASYRRRPLVSAVLLLPFVLLAGSLARAVLNQ